MLKPPCELGLRGSEASGDDAEGMRKERNDAERDKVTFIKFIKFILCEAIILPNISLS